jgi:hypothetical protein
MPKRTILSILILGVAGAWASKPYLTTSHAHAAIQRYVVTQGGTATSCQRVARTRVDCGVSIPLRVTPGPGTVTATATIQAFLRGGVGPYLERVREWAYTITLPGP